MYYIYVKMLFIYLFRIFLSHFLLFLLSFLLLFTCNYYILSFLCLHFLHFLGYIYSFCLFFFHISDIFPGLSLDFSISFFLIQCYNEKQKYLPKGIRPMSFFYNENNLFNIIFNKLGDIIIANLLFLLCSIPLITIGPALTALYHCTLRIVKGNNPGTAKIFFRAFKDNFRQSVVVWTVFLCTLLILLLNIRFLLSTNNIYGQLFLYLTMGILALIIIGVIYIFPVIAAFSNTLKNLLRNSYIFAFMHFPSTAAVTVITLLPMYMTYRDLHLLPLYAFCWFFFGFALTAWINSFFFYRIFKPYLEQETNSELPVSDAR